MAMCYRECHAYCKVREEQHGLDNRDIPTQLCHRGKTITLNQTPPVHTTIRPCCMAPCPEYWSSRALSLQGASRVCLHQAVDRLNSLAVSA